MARVWEGGGEEGTPGRRGTWMGRLRASKQAGRQVWGGRTPQGSSLTSLPRREHGQEEGSRPQSAGCGLWPPPRPLPRAAARLRACGFAAASPMLERRPGVTKVLHLYLGRVRVGCFLLGGRWLPCIQGKYFTLEITYTYFKKHHSGRVRVGCFLLGGRWIPCIQGNY